MVNGNENKETKVMLKTNNYYLKALCIWADYSSGANVNGHTVWSKTRTWSVMESSTASLTLTSLVNTACHERSQIILWMPFCLKTENLKVDLAILLVSHKVA